MCITKCCHFDKRGINAQYNVCITHRGTGISALGKSPRRRSPPIGGERLRAEIPWAEDKSIFLIKGVFFIFRPREFRPIDARPILTHF